MRTTLAVMLVMVLPFSVALTSDALDGRVAAPQPKEQRWQFKVPPKSPVYDIAFSPDGKLLAVACEEHEILIFDAVTGEQRKSMDTKLKRVWAVAFAPDSKTLVSGCGPYDKAKDPGELSIWDVQTSKQVLILAANGHKGAICNVVYAADGQSLVSADWDGTVRVWDLATGVAKTVLTEHKGPVRVVAFSPDGKVLASCGFDGDIVFWDAKTFKKQRTVKAHVLGAQCLAFAPSGRTFATCNRPKSPTGKGEVKIWDFATGRELKQVQGINSFMLHLQFSKDERVLAVSGGNRQKSAEVKLIEVVSGNARANLVGHKEWVECVRFSPDGRALVSGGGNVLKNPGELRITYLADLLPAKAAGDISAKEAERLWTILAGDDAVAAYRAISLLAAAPAPTLALLKEHVQPPPPLDVKTTLNLIKELDSEVFRIREKATQALTALGEPAEEMLVKALKDNLPLEVRMRLEMVLAGQAKLTSGMLQQYRAIEVLEQIGSPAAQEILENLAKGQANTRLSQEAQATLKRLSKGP